MIAPELADTMRVLALLYGGIVVGLGLGVLRDRARMWRTLAATGRSPLRDPAYRAVVALGIVNLLVMAYVTATLVSHWHHDLSWRWPLVLAIFTLKARMLWDVRLATIEQEHRLTLPARSVVPPGPPS